MYFTLLLTSNDISPIRCPGTCMKNQKLKFVKCFDGKKGFPNAQKQVD